MEGYLDNHLNSTNQMNQKMVEKKVAENQEI